MISGDDRELKAKIATDPEGVRKQEIKNLKGYTDSALSFRKYLRGDEMTYEEWAAENNKKVDDNGA